MSRPVIIIAAMSSERVIGMGNGMPWDVPEEYAQFLRQVERQTLVMGRRSFEIFGADLDRTHLIVISRSLAPTPKYRVARSLAEALDEARAEDRSIFIGGGASIYEQAIRHADRLHLSVIKGDFPGDAFFPEFAPQHWRQESAEHHDRYSYFQYARST